MNTAVLTPSRTVEAKRRQLLEWSSRKGVSPEFMLAMCGMCVPLCDVIQFAADAGLSLPALLSVLDCVVDYLRDGNA